MTGAAADAGVRIGGGGLRPGRSARWIAALALAAIAAALVARDAGVQGPAALPDVLRAGAATVVVFGICGWAPARLLVPPALAAWRPLFLLPFGAVTCGFALTVLGFAAVPFKPALVIVLAAAAGAGLAAHRRAAGPPARDRDRLALGGVAAVALLIAALALVPTFRSGVATVTGFGSDAHQVTGSATFLQHNYPASVDADYPIDRVPLTWRSKFPIYYALGAVATVSGLEPWQVLMTVSAILLALAATGFFLIARWAFGAPAGFAAAAMAVAVLDRWVFHLALHPYYNQLWGMLTLPFSLVLGYAWVNERSARTLLAFAAVTAMGALAYPLMLPFPLLTVAGFLLLHPDRPSLDPRRLWHGRRSLAWLIPVGLLLAVPLYGVAEKFADALVILGDPSDRLIGWQGDLRHFPPAGEFFALPAIPAAPAAITAILVMAGLCLWRVPRRLGIPLAAVLGLALVWAVWFRSVRYGQYFYFKILSFTAPQILTIAIAGLAILPRRTLTKALAAGATAAMCAGALLVARDEIAISFDQLQPQVVELRDWSEALPPGASVRLDTVPNKQLWEAYFLSDRPLGSARPITDYPHVPYSEGADYALDETLRPPPADAVGPPLRRNSALRLWRLRPGLRDTTSRRQVQVITEVSL